MTIKEFFESKDKIAIHCDTPEKSDRLCTAFEDNGYKWNTGKSYTETTNWDVYEKDTCYSNSRQYGHLGWYEHGGFQVIDFDDIEL